MRWWLLDDAPILGGAELFALRLARHLHTAGEDVTVLTPAASAFGGRVAQAGLRLRDLPLVPPGPRGGTALVTGVLATRRLLREAARSDAVVLANTAGAQAYASVAAVTLRRRPPILHLAHEQMTAGRATARMAFRHVGAVVATGANTAAAYRRALGGVEVAQLNNFLDADAFVTQPPAPARRPPVVGVLGRMIPEKGIAEAVDELAAARGEWSRARIAAPPQDAAYAAVVRASIARHALTERIELLDWAEPAPFIDASDVVLVPSTGLEGQPTVIVEALARGRPVVVREAVWSSDFEGLPVVAYRDGAQLAAALAAPPAVDAAALAEAARRFGPEQAVAALRAAAARAG